MLYSIFFFFMFQAEQDPFEGILIYRTDHAKFTNISTYYIMPGHIGIDSKSYEPDSIFTVKYHYDMTKNCGKCYTIKENSKQKRFVQREPKEYINYYEVIDSTSHNRVINVHYYQDLIGFRGNEMYETRVEDTSLLINIPEGFSISVPPISHHSKYIATKVTKTKVLDTGSYRKETEIVTKLMAKIPMKLSERYFEIE